MRTITCPKCKDNFSVSISDAIDEHGEVYICPHCGWKLRYVEE